MTRRQAPRGAEDLLPERIPFHEHVFGTCRAACERYGYREIRTPLFEDTALFERSLGEATDVVSKEMFTVERGDTRVSFRPEGTASVVRAYLQHNLDKTRAFQKLYYMGPMFRFERPQAGRQRQFDQIGVEALGASSPLLDAEVVALAHRCFTGMGLRNVRICLNSIGDTADREQYRDVLRAHMEPLLGERCDDCKVRFERNVFRMLDCKVEGCQPSNRSAPLVVDHLTEPSRERFAQTRAALDALDVPYELDPAIVRGLDYYTHTVFEVRCPDLGARDAVCGGGRYDHLIEELGGPDLGAVGFAIGVTPTLLALELQKHPAAAGGLPALDIYVAAVAAEQRLAALQLAEQLRSAGLQADTDFEDRSLKATFKAANKRGARLMLVLGADEVANGAVKVKDFGSGDETVLANDGGLAGALTARLQAVS
ncbi:MAG: histidine--tRNA ligase [Planctomycetota bacterium]